MKHKILAIIMVATLIVSCNQKNKEATITNQHMMDNDSTMMHNDSTMMDNDSTMMNNDSKMMQTNAKTYSCPMHPEVQGNLNDKCSKCGMKLTVAVPQTSEENK
jgi:hypothetical protein